MVIDDCVPRKDIAMTSTPLEHKRESTFKCYPEK
jgi:hypothetical protein